MSCSDVWKVVPFHRNGTRNEGGWITTPVWDCFARLGLVTPALSPSSLCYPTRPGDADEGGAFQDAPNFCHCRPRRSFGVHFHAQHGFASEMRHHLLANVCAVGLTSSPKRVDVKKMGKCGKRVWVRLGVILSLSVSWARWCNRNVDGTQEVANWVRCVHFCLPRCLDCLCPWIFLANLEAANGENTAQATMAGLDLELIAPAVLDAAYPIAERSFLLELQACPQCLDETNLTVKSSVEDWM